MTLFHNHLFLQKKSFFHFIANGNEIEYLDLFYLIISRSSTLLTNLLDEIPLQEIKRVDRQYKLFLLFICSYRSIKKKLLFVILQRKNTPSTKKKIIVCLVVLPSNMSSVSLSNSFCTNLEKEFMQL
jgi:hypothetical protein